MACSFEILLPEPHGEIEAGAAVEALNLIDRLEDQMTIYRETSELSLINRRAGLETVKVESRLFELLQLAQRIWSETEGAFDISAGALSRLWGFHQREGRWVDAAEVRSALRRVGMQHVRLDKDVVVFEVDGLELNLGSIGKGYAVDRAAETLVESGVGSALLSGGQSSLRAIGALPGRLGWNVGLGHPLHPDRHAAKLTLRDRGMSTSGIGEQHFERGGRRYGHILDPRTGRPAESGMLSVTVVAPTAAVADALATAFFILGLDWSVEYCRQHTDIGAVLIAEGTNGNRMETVQVGMDDGDLEMLI
jgi:thiamine biosynthesis lipoprotein